MKFFNWKKDKGSIQAKAQVEEESLEKIILSAEEAKEISFKDRMKAFALANAIAAGVGIGEQFLSRYGNVKITSTPWQCALTAFLIGSNYIINKRILKDRKSALLQSLVSIGSSACTLDYVSYATAGLMSYGNPWNKDPPGAWAKKVFKGDLVNFLVDPIHENFQIPRAYAFSYSASALYFGFQKLAEKYPKIRKVVEDMKKKGDKVLELFTKSRKKKYAAGAGISLAFGALSGNMYMAIPIFASIGVSDALNYFQRRKRPQGLSEPEATNIISG